MEKLVIKYVGHACFKLTYGETELVLDPYEDGLAEEFKPVWEEAHYVYCSHEHYDHNSIEAVVQKQTQGELPFQVEERQVPHDRSNGSERGMNTIRIFTFGDIRLAHLGDTGRMLTEEEMDWLSGLDCMLIPVGGVYTIDADEAGDILDRTQPRVAIPMHYRSSDKGIEEIDTIEPFIQRVGEVQWGGCELALSKDTPRQVLILKQAMLREWV